MSGFSMRPGSVMQGTVTSSAQGPSPIPYAQSPQGQVRLTQFRFMLKQTICPWKKNFSPIGPAVWSAIRNIYIYIYTNILFYYID